MKNKILDKNNKHLECYNFIKENGDKLEYLIERVVAIEKKKFNLDNTNFVIENELNMLRELLENLKIINTNINDDVVADVNDIPF